MWELKLYVYPSALGFFFFLMKEECYMICIIRKWNKRSWFCALLISWRRECVLFSLFFHEKEGKQGKTIPGTSYSKWRLLCLVRIPLLSLRYSWHRSARYLVLVPVTWSFSLFKYLRIFMFSLFYGIYRRAAAKIVFDATRRIIQTRPPRQGGEVFNTVPSPERYTNSYIKPNTGDAREPSPPSAM